MFENFLLYFGCPVYLQLFLGSYNGGKENIVCNEIIHLICDNYFHQAIFQALRLMDGHSIRNLEWNDGSCGISVDILIGAFDFINIEADNGIVIIGIIKGRLRRKAPMKSL